MLRAPHGVREKAGDYNRVMKNAKNRSIPPPGKRSSTRHTLRHPNLLGGLTAEAFLAEYWQKKPLLIRNAIPGFGDALDKAGILQLAARDDVESRFVTSADGGWELLHGPFPHAQRRRWKAPWSVLVQGMNLVLPAGDELLAAFDFIPYARLDDLMVSYATDGGGVGPHFDSYDVFLLQGMGRRRWRIGKQADRTLVEGLPVRILKNFKPRFDWILEPGDMLYLPPDWAHDGVAQGECMTWSIGFRAAPAQELADQFLTFLQERLRISGEYRDPDLRLQNHPSEIGKPMIEQVAAMLDHIRWDKALVRDFLGSLLTEPKPHVFFDPPPEPLTFRQFKSTVARKGLHLDPRTKFLFSERRFYLNGEPAIISPDLHGQMRALADARRLSADACSNEKLVGAVYDWYLDGFLHSGT